MICGVCDGCNCDFLFKFDGEITNGMEMKSERDDYVNKLRDAASAYFQDFRDQFEKIGEPYAQFKRASFLAQ